MIKGTNLSLFKSAGTYTTINGQANTRASIERVIIPETIPPALEITFTNIESAPVSNVTNVSDWNTLFDLPANGTPFTSVIIERNTVKLLGGSGITLKRELFHDYEAMDYYVISVIDNAGCVSTINPEAFHSQGMWWDDVLTTIYFPAVTYIGFSAFSQCFALTNINIPSCINLGGNSEYNNVFTANITERIITLTVPTELMHCLANSNGLGGWDYYPNGDIQRLLDRDYVTVIEVQNALPPALELSFNTYYLADAIGIPGDHTDREDVSTWNTFFDLPTYGNPFIGVLVSGRTTPVFKLYGGSDIIFKQNLFHDDTIVKVYDYAGSVIELEESAMGETAPGGMGGGCPNLTDVYFPEVTHLGPMAFYGGTNLVNIHFPKLQTTDNNVFCSIGIIECTFPELTLIGSTIFSGCVLLKRAYFPKALSMPFTDTFQYCLSLEVLYLPLCTQIGPTVLNNNNFYGTEGATLTLTIPASLMTCNSGDPDGDINRLIGTNNVTTLNGLKCLKLTYDFFMAIPFQTVSEWNTFFNLPARGTPFSFVSFWNGNVYLYGAPLSITVSQLFISSIGNGPNLIGIVDYGVIASIGYVAFGKHPDYPGGCPNLASVEFLETPIISSTLNFNECGLLSNIVLPKCTQMGSSVGDNNSFLGVTGNIINLTVPAALMTCNGGNPDGDIAYLQANNTVTVIEV